MADKLDRSELISATQSAIWAVANADSNDSFYYRTTAMTGRKLNNWGGYLHEYHPEITNFNDSMTSKKYYVYPEIGARIDALRDFLLELDPVESEEIVISNLEIVESFPVMAKEGVYTVALQVELNDSGSSKKDDIAITVFVDGEEAKTVDVKRGTEVYDLTVEAQAGQTIEAVVSGIQILPEDVYFYEPEGGRETSQCLIGVAEGETSVYSQAEVTLEIEELEPVTADLQLQKTTMSGKKLSGAEFELFVVGEDATISIGTFEVDEDGMLSVEDLLPGSYELEEITAPDGYVEMDDNIEFEITEEGKFEMSKHKLASFKKGTLVIKNKAEKSKTTPSNPDIEIPDEDVPLTEIPDEEVPLAEIPELFGDDHYAYIIGYPDGMVHPEGKITRAEVATIFFRLLDEEIRTALMTDVNNFSDVAKGQWYNHAVSTLSSIGVILGRDNGSFDPNAFITRAEFAAIAARFDPTGNPEGVFFTDIAGHWAEREIIIAANNGWVEGYNGLFRPDDYITRAEAMTLVNRVLHRLPETEHDLLEYMVIWPDNMDVNAWYYLAVQEATNSHDYNRKPNPVFETWTEFMEPYDWSLLEY